MYVCPDHRAAGQAFKTHGSYKLSPDTQEYDEAHFEVCAADEYSSINSVISLTLNGRSSPWTTEEYLYDRDWLLRYALFDCIDVSACAGGRSLEE